MLKRLILQIVVLCSSISALFLSNQLHSAQTNVQNFRFLTIPKSGSHLLAKVLTLMIGESAFSYWGHTAGSNNRRDQYYFTRTNHQYYSRHLKKIILIRDLRDVFLSMVFHIDRTIKTDHVDGSTKPPKILADCYSRWQKMTFDEKLMTILEDGDASPFQNDVMRIHFEEALKLMQLPNTMVCRFEHLVGPKGGGDFTSQFNEVARISQFLNLNLPRYRILHICREAFGPVSSNPTLSRTFHARQIGKWKEYYQPQHMMLFIEKYGEYQKQLGYDIEY